MAARDEILKAVRAKQPPAVELPNLNQAWIRFPDPPAQFAQLVESVGGQVLFVDSKAEIPALLASLPAYSQAKKMVSLVPDIVRGNVLLEGVEDPHQVEDIDFAILPGQFGVAENGAIWVTDQGLRHRVIYFLCQHLSLIISAQDIVHTMHDAYARLSFPEKGFGVFISGPSKTADIEQSLVIGAHGPRSLTVFCIRPPTPTL